MVKIYSKSDLPISLFHPQTSSPLWSLMKKCSESVTINATDSSSEAFLCESDRLCFQVQPLMAWPSPLIPPISLIRHSHTHIRCPVPPPPSHLFFFFFFCFTHWMAGCGSRQHKNSSAKTSSSQSQGKPSANSTHIKNTTLSAIQKTLWNSKWHCVH